MGPKHTHTHTRYTARRNQIDRARSVCIQPLTHIHSQTSTHRFSHSHNVSVILFSETRRERRRRRKKTQNLVTHKIAAYTLCSSSLFLLFGCGLSHSKSLKCLFRSHRYTRTPHTHTRFVLILVSYSLCFHFFCLDHSFSICIYFLFFYGLPSS